MDEHNDRVKKIKRDKGRSLQTKLELNLARAKAMSLRLSNDILERVNDVGLAQEARERDAPTAATDLV